LITFLFYFGRPFFRAVVMESSSSSAERPSFPPLPSDALVILGGPPAPSPTSQVASEPASAQSPMAVPPVGTQSSARPTPWSAFNFDSPTPQTGGEEPNWAVRGPYAGYYTTINVPVYLSASEFRKLQQQRKVVTSPFAPEKGQQGIGRGGPGEVDESGQGKDSSSSSSSPARPGSAGGVPPHVTATLPPEYFSLISRMALPASAFPPAPARASALPGETSSLPVVQGQAASRYVLPLLPKPEGFSELPSADIPKKRVRKVDPNHIPRPLNAFMIFRSEHQAQVRRDNPKFHNSDVSKEIASMWKLLSLQEKAHYERRAEAIKELHHTVHPTWQYTSKRKDTPTADDKESASSTDATSSARPFLTESAWEEGVSQQGHAFEAVNMASSPPALGDDLGPFPALGAPAEDEPSRGKKRRRVARKGKAASDEGKRGRKKPTERKGKKATKEQNLGVEQFLVEDSGWLQLGEEDPVANTMVAPEANTFDPFDIDVGVPLPVGHNNTHNHHHHHQQHFGMPLEFLADLYDFDTLMTMTMTMAPQDQ